MTLPHVRRVELRCRPIGRLLIHKRNARWLWWIRQIHLSLTLPVPLHGLQSLPSLSLRLPPQCGQVTSLGFSGCPGAFSNGFAIISPMAKIVSLCLLFVGFSANSVEEEKFSITANVHQKHATPFTDYYRLNFSYGKLHWENSKKYLLNWASCFWLLNAVSTLCEFFIAQWTKFSLARKETNIPNTRIANKVSFFADFAAAYVFFFSTLGANSLWHRSSF